MLGNSLTHLKDLYPKSGLGVRDMYPTAKLGIEYMIYLKSRLGICNMYPKSGLGIYMYRICTPNLEGEYNSLALCEVKSFP